MNTTAMHPTGYYEAVQAAPARPQARPSTRLLDGMPLIIATSTGLACGLVAWVVAAYTLLHP